MPNWSLQQEQTLFTLGMLPNLASCYSGTALAIEAQLLPRVTGVLKDLAGEIGTWTLLWGPAVFELPLSNRPDNAMLVVRRQGGDPSLPQLVVAIAGTNPFAFLDWLVEDFLVTPQVPWATGHPTGTAMISKGTSIGLTALQTLRPGSGLPGSGLTLTELLATEVDGSITINVGGHSLGGALSPTLALWLHDTQAAWDPAGHATLSALASAGPTAGNLAFATYSNSQIGTAVTRLHNPLDIVPHAWATLDLLQLPTLYEPLIKPDRDLYDLTSLAVAISAFGFYTQIRTGQALQTLPPNPAHTDFFSQALYQHVGAYFDLLGIPQRHSIVECVKQAALSAGLGAAASRARLESQLDKYHARLRALRSSTGRENS